MHAVKSGSVETVQMLINSHANVNEADVVSLIKIIKIVY
jgi:hypothetical protein